MMHFLRKTDFSNIFKLILQIGENSFQIIILSVTCTRKIKLNSKTNKNYAGRKKGRRAGETRNPHKSIHL
jgi:hypothetical protein